MKVFSFDPIFKKSVISKNLKLITEHHPHSRAVAVGVFVSFGSRHESLHQNGIAHLIEHMVFKKTKNYNTFELTKKIEGLGGELNAYTTRELTCFHTTVLQEDLETALEILSEVTQKAVFILEEFEKEKRVVLQEIESVNDEAEEMLSDTYFKEVYCDQPIARPILGTPQSLASINLKDIEHIYKKQYSHLLISIAGSVDHDQAINYISKHFYKSDQLESFTQNPLNPVRYTKALKLWKAPFEQTHLLLGFQAPSFCNKSSHLATFGTAVLGRGMASRLFQLLREKHALVYSIYAYLSQTDNSGLFLISSSTSSQNISSALELILTELSRLKTHGVTEEELKFFKKQLIGEFILMTDDIEQRMEAIAYQEMALKTYKKVDETLEKMNNVTRTCLNDFMMKYIKDISFLMMGNLPDSLSTSSQAEEKYRDLLI